MQQEANFELGLLCGSARIDMGLSAAGKVNLVRVGGGIRLTSGLCCGDWVEDEELRFAVWLVT